VTADTAGAGQQTGGTNVKDGRRVIAVFDSVAAAERWRGDRAADTTAIRPLSRRLVADKERM